MAISGNSITLDGGGCAIDLNGVSGAAITGNSINSLAGTSWGVVLRQWSHNSVAGPNAFAGVTTHYIDLGGNEVIQ